MEIKTKMKDFKTYRIRSWENGYQQVVRARIIHFATDIDVCWIREEEDSDRMVVSVRRAFYIRPDGDTMWVERIKQRGQ